VLHDFVILFGSSLFCFALLCFFIFLWEGWRQMLDLARTIVRPSKNNCELFGLLDCRDQSSNKRKGSCLMITQWRLFRCFPCHNWGRCWAWCSFVMVNTLWPHMYSNPSCHNRTNVLNNQLHNCKMVKCKNFYCFEVVHKLIIRMHARLELCAA
jgi:hypothetical protein